MHFELYKNWNGLLIEPLKEKYLQCKNFRSKNNKYYNCACVSKHYNKKFVQIIFSNLRTITNHKKNNIDPTTHINKEDLNIYQKHKVITVNARTLNSLLLEAGSPKIIDLLSLDTEGYEDEVLTGINFETYIFKYILIETKNFKSTNEILKMNRYNLQEKLTHHDYLFRYNEN